MVEQGIDFREHGCSTHGAARCPVGNPIRNPLRHAAQSGVVVVVDSYSGLVPPMDGVR